MRAAVSRHHGEQVRRLDLEVSGVLERHGARCRIDCDQCRIATSLNAVGDRLIRGGLIKRVSNRRVDYSVGRCVLRH